MEDHKLNEMIFCDVNNIAYLSKTKGKFYKFDDKLIYHSKGKDSIIRSQSKLSSLAYLGEEYKNVYLTYIPAKEYDYYYTEDNYSFIYQQPLIKLSENKTNKDDVICFLSGRRSAIVFDPINSTFIRLKGCGNLFKGFNLENVDDLGNNHFEVRGCQFKNTCLRELIITDTINKEFNKRGQICGNIPIGFYLYEDEGMIDKYCGIYKTLGDKRFGSNFFDSLNILLSNLFSEINIYKKTCMFNFDKMKIKNSKIVEKKIIITFNDLILENNYFKEKTQDRELFDYLKCINTNTENIEEILKMEENVLKILFNENFKENKFIDKVEFIKIIERMIISLNEKKMSLIHLIIIVLSKMCYEVGLTKKIFEEMNLNWGTYDYHCNAHLDNFILLPSNDKKVYLAPVDFDLSFMRDEFIDINYKNAKGIETKVDFDELLEREKNSLIVQLIGINSIPNINVNVLDLESVIKANNDSGYLIENFITLLKENMVEYFLKGFFKENIDSLDEYYQTGADLVKILLSINII